MGWTKSAKLRTNKIPELFLIFWIIKILSTTVGETCADFVSTQLEWGQVPALALMVGLLSAALFLQLRASRYIPSIYWITVVLISIVGTQVTDLLTDKLGVSLYWSTSVFTVALAGLLFTWFALEKTLSVTSIFSTRREVFYWLTILCTFALGTAVGDLTTEALGLGFKIGTLLFGALLPVTWIAFKAGLPATAAFWIAYIFSRPFGASLGDLLSQSREYGGIGLGAFTTSALFLGAITILVAHLTIRQNRTLRASRDPGFVTLKAVQE